MKEKSYMIKRRLTQSSSFARVAKAVGALGYELKTDWRGATVTWDELSMDNMAKPVFKCKNLTYERVPEWLNEQLEEKGLLKPQENAI